mmetsp:Transcript_9414/g.26009  ORF Transcript_9414/g.26009 Transcript_9414/m.26009 type:complete len:344 (+) Transcript_9414:12-1043(+)
MLHSNKPKRTSTATASFIIATMKISAIALSLFAAGVKADFSLRSAMNFGAQVEDYDVRVIVSGLSGAVSESEAKKVGSIAVASYNKQVLGGKIKTLEVTGAANSNSFGKDESAFINARVSLASDNMLGSFFGAEVSNEDTHAGFEQDLCESLRSSDMSNFAKAKDCSFSFLAKPGMTKQVPVEKTYSTAHDGQSAQAEIILAGAKTLSTEDHKFLDEVVEASHNEAFAKYGLALASFETVADVAVGGYQGWLQQCTPCCYDDEPWCPESVQNQVTVVVGNAIPLRTGELSDIRAIDIEIANDAFETLLCTKLRNSGKAAFNDVHTCQFGFLYTEVSGGATLAN